MPKYAAHSPDLMLSILTQSYEDHVHNVRRMAINNALNAIPNDSPFRNMFLNVVGLSADRHDLGKLDDLCQPILQGYKECKLPINHVDAGVKDLTDNCTMTNFLAALSVLSHHYPLPNLKDQSKYDNPNFHFLRYYADKEKKIPNYSETLRNRTDKCIKSYLEKHNEVIEKFNPSPCTETKVNSMFIKMALSCLVSGDHYDTAQNYQQPVPFEGPKLKPKERLAALKKYIESISKDNKRSQLRTKYFNCCKNFSHKIAYSDAPVGIGKTTFNMSYALNSCIFNRMNQIFVIAPYTSLIDQLTEDYRRSVVLPGENPEEVVAPHHHRIEFGSMHLRQYSTLWNAPIIITTAVQFFESMASSHPVALRKLHNLARSAIIVDESDSCLPIHLWKMAYTFLKQLTDDWGCHVLLTSGTISKFWEIKEVIGTPEDISNVNSVKIELDEYEEKRVKVKSRKNPITYKELCKWTTSFKGSKFIIVNTVQIASVIARELCLKYGRNSVEHLSTGIRPKARKDIEDRIKQRLKNNDDFTLVATSCAECGLDISFRNGFRQRCSFCSLKQSEGRVAREGIWTDSELWDFDLEGELINYNPIFSVSRIVVEDMIKEGKTSHTYSTEALRREIIRKKDIKDLTILDKNLQFRDVDKEFRVIPAGRVTCIVDHDIANKMRNGDKIYYRDISDNSLEIFEHNVKKYNCIPINEEDNIFEWVLDYDDFLGYMAGVLPLLQ